MISYDAIVKMKFYRKRCNSVIQIKWTNTDSNCIILSFPLVTRAAKLNVVMFLQVAWQCTFQYMKIKHCFQMTVEFRCLFQFILFSTNQLLKILNIMKIVNPLLVNLFFTHHASLRPFFSFL